MPVPKRQKKCEEGAPSWLLTWGDLTTLLLTFFVVMYNVGTIDEIDLNIMLSAFQGLGPREGGNTLETGKLAELGNTVMTLPTMERGTVPRAGPADRGFGVPARDQVAEGPREGRRAGPDHLPRLRRVLPARERGREHRGVADPAAEPRPAARLG